MLVPSGITRSGPEGSTGRGVDQQQMGPVLLYSWGRGSESHQTYEYNGTEYLFTSRWVYVSNKQRKTEQ